MTKHEQHKNWVNNITCDEEDLKLISDFAKHEKLHEKTRKNYASALNHFMSFTGLHVHEIISIFEAERSKGVLADDFTVLLQINNFFEHMYIQDLKNKTRRLYYNEIRKFFMYYGVPVPLYPKNKRNSDVNPKSVSRKTRTRQYKEQILVAINKNNILLKSYSQQELQRKLPALVQYSSFIEENSIYYLTNITSANDINIREFHIFLEKEGYTESSIRTYCNVINEFFEVIHGLRTHDPNVDSITRAKNRNTYKMILDYTREFDEEDKKLLNQFKTTRNIKSSTLKGYHVSLRAFISFADMQLHEILDVAKKEQKQGVNPYELTIYNLIDKFRAELMDTSIAPNTVHTYWSKAATFFRNWNIFVPELRPIQTNTSGKVEEITYDDLPDKECIICGCDYRPDFKPYLLFSSSSGTARAECLSITVEMWLNGCKDFIDDDSVSITKQLHAMMDRRDVVPVIKLQRRKTYKTYYTCCSPEASYYINKSLYERGNVRLENKIFPFSDSYIVTSFADINDHFGWGFVGRYRRFRSHMMRKFHASNLGCDPFIIDRLEGRSKNKLHETYIKTNPDELRNIYRHYMHNVMMYPERWDCPGLDASHMDEVKELHDFNDMAHENKKKPQAVEIAVDQQTQPVQQSTIPPVQPVQTQITMATDVGALYMELGKMQQQIQELREEIKELKSG